MNEEFQQALRAGDLEGIRRVPKADLHNHGWAGADPASVGAILGRRIDPIDQRLASMDEMHTWAGENFGKVDPKLTPFRDATARMRWSGYAGDIGEASAACLADWVVVDMFAQAVSGQKSPKEAAREAEPALPADAYQLLTTGGTGLPTSGLKKPTRSLLFGGLEGWVASMVP